MDSLMSDEWDESRVFEHIRAGLAELEAGEGVSHELVEEWLDSWATENELPLPIHSYRHDLNQRTQE